MIFKNECKRIVRPITLVFLVVVSVLWYLAFMKSCNMYLDDNMGMPYAVGKEYVRRFGTTIDFNEIEEVKKDHEAAKSELNALIEQYMGEYGIKTKDEYDDYSEKYSVTFRNKKSDDYRNAVSEWGEEEFNRREEIYDKLESIYWDHSLPVIFAVFKEQSIRYYVENYENLLEARKAYEDKTTYSRTKRRSAHMCDTDRCFSGVLFQGWRHRLYPLSYKFKSQFRVIMV